MPVKLHWKAQQTTKREGDVPQGTIERVYYEISAFDPRALETRTIIGSVLLDAPGKKFIPAEELTEAKLLAWVKADKRARFDADRLTRWIETGEKPSHIAPWDDPESP